MNLPNRWPPSRRDPRIDAIPESSWVTVTPYLLALMHADKARAAAERAERLDREKQRRTRRSMH